MFIIILQHTPTWVFVLFAVLVAFGLQQRFAGSMPLRRVTILPFALAALSLAGAVSTFGATASGLLAWAGGFSAGLLAAQAWVDTSAVRFDAATRRLHMPGSWLPLVLMMALFALKFFVGVSLAQHPELRSAAGFALAASGAYGLFSGAFVGRALALWSAARAARVSVGVPA
jgi:hypothetical protein